MPGAFWRVVSAARGADAVHRPHRLPRHPQRGSGGRATSRKHAPTRSLRALFLAGERCDPETLAWAQEKLRIPVVDHWWQTETGWPVCREPHGHRGVPGEARVGHQARARLRRPRARREGQRRARRPERRHRHQAAAAARLPAHALRRRGRLPARLPLALPGLLPHRRRRATSTRTATSPSWAASTTSSTSPATGSPPAPWRKCSPRTRTWRSARWWG